MREADRIITLATTILDDENSSEQARADAHTATKQVHRLISDAIECVLPEVRAGRVTGITIEKDWNDAERSKALEAHAELYGLMRQIGA